MIQFEEESGQDAISTETMTPMIDVILSLIAFMMLMINAPMLTMDVELPEINQAQTQSVSEEKVVNLEILAEKQQWRIDGELITSQAALKAQLQTVVIDAKQQVATVLTVDQNSPAQRMIETLDILQRLGINNAHIALQNKQAPDA